TAATLSGGGYVVSVAGFKAVRATAGGSQDVANLYDSAGDDLYAGTPDSSTLQSAQQGGAASYFNVAAGFGHVYATSSTGNDLATLFDSAGSDNFVGSRAFSYLTGASYVNQVTNFFKVLALGGKGGSDTATLLDSAQNDVFEGTGASGVVFGSDYVVEADAFAAVTAVAGSGGSDDLYLQVVNFAFSQSG